MRRIFDTPVTCPNVIEFTTELMPEKYAVLKTLFACILSSSDRVSLIVIVLFSVILNVNCAGPSMMFRPASPYVLPAGFVQSVPGVQNAAVLNHSAVVGFATRNGWPATTFARNDPLTPRSISTEAPKTRGVRYSPEPIV